MQSQRTPVQFYFNSAYFVTFSDGNTYMVLWNGDDLPLPGAVLTINNDGSLGRDPAGYLPGEFRLDGSQPRPHTLTKLPRSTAYQRLDNYEPKD